MEFSNDQITLFLRELIELGGGNEVDTNSEKYIRSVATGDVCEIPQNNQQKKLAVYGTQARDAVIINPFADGELGNMQNMWFYHSRNILMSALLIKIMKHILGIAANANNAKKNAGAKDETVIKYLGKYAVNVDDKMVKEFSTISANVADFASIYYNKAKRRSEFRCVMFLDSAKSSYTNIRKASWEPLQKILLKVLNVKDIKDFTVAPSSAAIPTFESFVNVYLNVFDAIKEPLKLVDIYVDTTAIRGHLPQLDLYYNRAKWCSSNTNIQQAGNTNTSAPWNSTPGPVPASGSLPGPMPAGGMPGPMPATGSMSGPVPANGMRPVSAYGPVSPSSFGAQPMSSYGNVPTDMQCGCPVPPNQYQPPVVMSAPLGLAPASMTSNRTSGNPFM